MAPPDPSQSSPKPNQSTHYFQLPTSSAVPVNQRNHLQARSYAHRSPRLQSQAQESPSTSARPTPNDPIPQYPTPLYRVHLDDASHKGTADFLSATSPATALQAATANVLRHLYDVRETATREQEPEQEQEHEEQAQVQGSEHDHESTSPTPPPPVRSVTLVLRSMDGVAYTTSIPLDVQHKEIHFNLGYISTRPLSVLKTEVLGVLTHEMVHVWQFNAQGTCPGGLIEGIADWVRLKAGLAARHWKEIKAPVHVAETAERETGNYMTRIADGKANAEERSIGQGQAEWSWDAGYEKTGFFLDWLEEKRCGKGTVRMLNAWLGCANRYTEIGDEGIWKQVCGDEVLSLWKEYQDMLGRREEGGLQIGLTRDR